MWSEFLEVVKFCEVLVKLKVIIKPGEDSGFVAQVPALKGCWSQGVSREEALANAREAIEAWLETEQDKDDKSDALADVQLVTV
jgi:predicted RNase H-like HicB family nuclease